MAAHPVELRIAWRLKVGRAIVKADKENRTCWRRVPGYKSIPELSRLLCDNGFGPDEGYPLLADPHASFVELPDLQFRLEIESFIKQSGKQSDKQLLGQKPKRLPLRIIG